MANKQPVIVLNNGKRIPQVGLGTWNSPPGQVKEAVKNAIDVGYRHIDCAHVYGNEHEIGEAIAEKIAEGVIKREDVFLTSKVWNNSRRKDLVLPALKNTLKNLQVDYVDLYLIHWPFSYAQGDELFPRGSDGKLLHSDVDYVETWAELEKANRIGLAKSIGVSNFNKSQIDRLLRNCETPPATNQVECHPYLAQLKLSEYLEQNGITLTAYSPLGSPARPWVNSTDPVLLEEPVVLELAKKYNKNPAQILIRWQLQRGHIVIPKSVTKERIESNFNVTDFSLTTADVKAINGLDRDYRFCLMDGDIDSTHHEYYPFHDEY